MSQQQNNNHRNNNNQGGGKQNQARIDQFVLTDTVIGAEPILAGFNITGSDIATFLKTYLDNVGITGSLVTVQAISTGSVSPKLGIIVSFNKSNKDIISNTSNDNMTDVLPVFTNNAQTGGLRASENLARAIMPLGVEKKTKVYRARNNKKFVYIPICPIKTISAMLKSVPSHSFISVVDVRRIKGEIIATVLKQSKQAVLGKSNNAVMYDESMNRHF